jgi:NADPH-dependent 2,4-dienoyl-CoA reductase/sulfur reductase-like enzyme
MEAAHRLAERGCAVTLLERQPELGGQLRFATIPAFKAELKEYLQFLVRRTQRSRVNTLLGTSATPTLLADLAPDFIVMANGSRPLMLESASTSIRVMTALDALASQDLGGDVAVVGGGSTGCEVALYLATRGARVSLVEATGALGGGIDPDLKDYLVSGLEQHGVEALLNTLATAVTPEGVAITGPGGLPTLPATAVVFAVGVEPAPMADLDGWLVDQGKTAFHIGDRRGQGGLRECTGDAAWVTEEVVAR